MCVFSGLELFTRNCFHVLIKWHSHEHRNKKNMQWEYLPRRSSESCFYNAADNFIWLTSIDIHLIKAESIWNVKFKAFLCACVPRDKQTELCVDPGLQLASANNWHVYKNSKNVCFFILFIAVKVRCVNRCNVYPSTVQCVVEMVFV